MPYGGKKRSKSLLLSLGLRPCSPMRMLSQVSELPCLTIPIRLVCPQADRKASKQNSCPWQYKKAPLEPQRYPSPGERLRPPSSGVLPSRQQSCVCRLPGTPPPSVYQVTHGTALQAAECYVMHHSPYARCPFGTHLYGIPRYPGCRFAFPWAMSLQLLQGAW